MENFSFPIPEHYANTIFGKQKKVFEETFIAFTQSGLVAEGTIQFNPSTKSFSVLKFSIEKERKDTIDKCYKIPDDIEVSRKPSAEVHQVHLEKKRDGTRGVQNFVSSVWGSQKPTMQRQMSKEEMYSNFFLDSNTVYNIGNERKYNDSREKHFQMRFRESSSENTDTNVKQDDNFDDDFLPSNRRSDSVFPITVPWTNARTAKAVSKEDMTDPIGAIFLSSIDRADILSPKCSDDLQEDCPKSPEMNVFNADKCSITKSGQNYLNNSHIYPVPTHTIEPLEKSVSCILNPGETGKQESPQIDKSTNAVSENRSEEISINASSEENESEESDENWDLKKFMDPFNEKYPDLNTEESLYENVMLNGENETTKGIFENVLMLADSNGFEMKDTSPTGNCMFQSINDQLQINGDFRFDVYTLRQVAVEYLKNHPTDSEGTDLECFLDEPWIAYLARMAKPYEWGDHLVLKALCEVLQRNIVVINVQSDDKTNHHEFVPKSLDQHRNETLYLGHLKEFHYVSLRLKGWKKTWISAALRNKNLETQICSTSESESELESHLLGHLSDVDPVSRMPIPYISFAMTQITEHSEICYLEPPNKVVPNEGSLISSAGGLSDGTAVMIFHKDKARHRREYLRRFTFENPFLIFYGKDTIVCNDGKAPLPIGQIYAEVRGIHPGYCNLHVSGNKQIMMIEKGVTINGSSDHSGRNVNGYQCLTWPVSAQECMSRNSIWPSPEIKEKIKGLGCFVAKRHHAYSRNPEVEWQFIFNEAEKILVKEALTMRQLYVYGVFKSCVDHHSQHLKYRLGTVHIKSTFFYACEQIHEDKFDESPGLCFLYLAQILLKHLKDRNVPNYFIKENNMIDHIRNDDIENLIQILEAIRCFPLHCLGFMMDGRGYNRSGIIDIIQKDGETYRKEMDPTEAICHVFFPIMIRQARKLSKHKLYREAYAKIRDARLLLVLAPQRMDGKPLFVPSLDSLLKQTLEGFDKDTVHLVTKEMKDGKIKFSPVMAVKDLTDGKDVGGFGELPLCPLIAGNPLEEAKLLNRYGVLLHNVDLNYKDAATYYCFALDKLKVLALGDGNDLLDEKKTDTGADVDVAKQLDLDCHHLAFVCFKNLILSDQLEKLEPRMPYLEQICIRGRFTKQVDFVMETWEKLGQPDSAAKFHSAFLEHIEGNK